MARQAEALCRSMENYPEIQSGVHFTQRSVILKLPCQKDQVGESVMLAINFLPGESFDHKVMRLIRCRSLRHLTTQSYR